MADFLLIPCLGIPKGLEGGLEHGRMVCDLDVLTVLGCDWYSRVKVTKQLFYWPEASYVKATVLPNTSHTLKCCPGWIISEEATQVLQ